MSWKDYLAASFGAADRRFAGHPNERENARRMLLEAGIARVTFAEIEREARSLLMGCSTAHVEEQLARLRSAASYLD
jgi:hypothetical protein